MFSPSRLFCMSLALFGLFASARAHAACGDGVHDADEACDDKARIPGDGCDSACQVESGWTCTEATFRPSFIEVLHDEQQIRGGFHRPPRFVTSSTGDGVQQLENAQAAIYGTAIPMSEVKLTVDVLVSQKGDDFVGLTVGYMPGERASAEADWLLLDWKQADYRSPTCRGSAGLALSRVSGPLKDVEDLWCHIGSVSELARANTLGGQGWVPGRSYRLRLEYSRSQVRVSVDGALELVVDGVFPEGELGLYAFSQEGVRWSLVAPRQRSVCAGLDTDQDGLIDATEVRLGLDPKRPDSDDDGVRDRREVGDANNPLDTDLDGKINALDPDDEGDGAPTAAESWDGDHDPTNDDTDRDGLPDYLDGDDDGDGRATSAERVGSTLPAKQDTDQDGRPDMVDIDDDGDGVLSATERGPNTKQPLDHDADGVPDFLDPDDDNDGVPSAIESYDGDRDPANDDTDRDGKPDYLDIDDDGDGMSTAAETGTSAGTGDVDFDGRPDHVDVRLGLPEGVTPTPPVAAEVPAPSAGGDAPVVPPEGAPAGAEPVGEAAAEGAAPAPGTPEVAACASAGGSSWLGLSGLALALGARRVRQGRGGKS